MKQLKTFRVKTDNSNQSPGWKFAQYEKSVPLRLKSDERYEESVCLVRRTTNEKILCRLIIWETAVAEQLEYVRNAMYQKALKNREDKTYEAKTLDEMKEIAENKPGFIKAMWCGDAACEAKLKEVAGVSSRCIPFGHEHDSGTCVCCGKPAEKLVYWGKAY